MSETNSSLSTKQLLQTGQTLAPLYDIGGSFHNLVTSKPEDGWSGELKCYFEIYDVLPAFNFRVWLIRSPVRSNVHVSESSFRLCSLFSCFHSTTFVK